MRTTVVIAIIIFCSHGFILQSCNGKERDFLSLKKEEDRTDRPQSEWITLFDGESFNGWHSYNQESVLPGWQIEDGAMVLDKSKGKGGYIITDEEFENFELQLEWKIAECGNSGIFWNIVESSKYGTPYLTAPEMQVLDNACHPDAKIDTHRAGDLYDMIETSVVNVHPAGQWNSVKIRTNEGRVTFWQNGAEVVQFTMHSSEWDKMVAKSKFKDWEAFGKSKKGKIGLQDHGDKVWFRNIKIKLL